MITACVSVAFPEELKAYFELAVQVITVPSATTPVHPESLLVLPTLIVQFDPLTVILQLVGDALPVVGTGVDPPIVIVSLTVVPPNDQSLSA